MELVTADLEMVMEPPARPDWHADPAMGWLAEVGSTAIQLAVSVVEHRAAVALAHLQEAESPAVRPGEAAEQTSALGRAVQPQQVAPLRPVLASQPVARPVPQEPAAQEAADREPAAQEPVPSEATPRVLAVGCQQLPPTKPKLHHLRPYASVIPLITAAQGTEAAVAREMVVVREIHFRTHRRPGRMVGVLDSAKAAVVLRAAVQPAVVLRLVRPEVAPRLTRQAPWQRAEVCQWAALPLAVTMSKLATRRRKTMGPL